MAFIVELQEALIRDHLESNGVGPPYEIATLHFGQPVRVERVHRVNFAGP